MGNFSVNHYARIEVGQPETDILFVLDLAELPSFELLQRWGLQAGSPRAELDSHAEAESKSLLRLLEFTANGKIVTPVWRKAEITISDGAGGLPVLRISTHARLAAVPGTLGYSDKTYPDRTAGWKEVVVMAKTGATLLRSSAGLVERSAALTAYPQDPTLSPPQDLTAQVEWMGQPIVMSKADRPAAAKPAAQTPTPVAPAASSPVITPPVIAPPTIPEQSMRPKPSASPGATVAEPNSMGQVKRGDFLSRTLKGKEIGWGLGLICVAVAFWFGALHALEPGHGKTMVAAYLVGERGTPKHALLLGGMVTFTHTVSVFILGLLTMFLSRYIRADVISKWLGTVSGLTILWIGGLLFYRRVRAMAEQSHGHSHGRGGHRHSHGGFTHSHGARTHSHAIEGEISMKSLIALGASGGLVPCPSALVLLLAAVSVGRIGFGLLLLASFSLGLALVLMATGLVVLYAKRFIPERKNKKKNPLLQLMPIVSAAVIVVVGFVLTGNALGVIPTIRFFG